MMAVVKIVLVQPISCVDDVKVVAVAEIGHEVVDFGLPFRAKEILKLLRDRRQDKGDGDLLAATGVEQVEQRLSRFGSELEVLEGLTVHVVGEGPTDRMGRRGVWQIAEQTPPKGIDGTTRLIKLPFGTRMKPLQMLVDPPAIAVQRRQ